MCYIEFNVNERALLFHETDIEESNSSDQNISTEVMNKISKISYRI